MKLYHLTSRAAAERIVARGFRDDTATFSTDAGVWVSDRPFDEASLGAAKSEVLVALEVPEDELGEYEVRSVLPSGEPVVVDAPAWATYREWIVPAAVLNHFRASLVVCERAVP